MTAEEILKLLTPFAFVIKIVFGCVFTWFITRSMSSHFKSIDDTKKDTRGNTGRIVQLEAMNSVNVEYRKLSKQERGDINRDLRALKQQEKDTNTKVNNLVQSFNEFKKDTFQGLNISPIKRDSILIYDDHPVSADLIKRKLSHCGDFSLILARNLSEAKYVLETNDIDQVFADLIHPTGNNAFAQMGLTLCKYVKSSFPKIKFTLYSALEKPPTYKGKFLPKNISVDDLRIYLSSL